MLRMLFFYNTNFFIRRPIDDKQIELKMLYILYSRGKILPTIILLFIRVWPYIYIFAPQDMNCLIGGKTKKISWIKFMRMMINKN